jgi:hypothetical protein
MLAGDSLTDFKKIFNDLAQSKNNLTEACAELREKLTSMWNTVVMPAFLLHAARPDRLPIIDQHTVRAFLALTRGEVQEDPKIDWKAWGDYAAFFQNAAVAAGCNNNWEERCRVDHALFAWGKTLKSWARLKPDAKPPNLPKPRIGEENQGARVQDRSVLARAHTLGKAKPFRWKIHSTGDIFIRRCFQNEKKPREKTIPHDVIDRLLQHLPAENWFPLANNVKKLKHDTEVDGIGSFLYKYEGFSLVEAQLASHLAALFTRAELWKWNQKPKDMMFQLKTGETEWSISLKQYYDRSLSNDTA